jgi:hypothetical protein
MSDDVIRQLRNLTPGASISGSVSVVPIRASQCHARGGSPWPARTCIPGDRHGCCASHRESRCDGGRRCTACLARTSYRHRPGCARSAAHVVCWRAQRPRIIHSRGSRNRWTYTRLRIDALVLGKKRVAARSLGARSGYRPSARVAGEMRCSQVVLWGRNVDHIAAQPRASISICQSRPISNFRRHTTCLRSQRGPRYPTR